eukprot:TRINITY_DN1324_c0_g1_i3.p1 TRINITY_DN1324_c0_g1~~TRINITY_DN1324_c0_g1_i3.p1  ORF type:complete len:453 (-),score=67.81 TRINITY_DN1324_c0_g1_i3:631-1989(-)
MQAEIQKRKKDVLFPLDVNYICKSRVFGLFLDHVRKHSSHAWKAPNGKQVDSVVVKNSLTNEKNPLILNENRHMSWYICGPTVYDHSHLGHARTYVSFDIIRRILSDHFHCNIFMVIGMTDVDDKILNRAAEKGVNWTTLARTFESDFIHDMQSLNVRSPSLYTRVTEHIPEIIDMTYALLQKGHAYESNGSVYYNIPSLRSGMNKLEPSRSAPRRGDEHEDEGYATDKKSPRDFALWKKTPQDTPGWDSPWGHGRPGWHIECSAMCGTYFGKSLDMHSGGVDLKFPHHENELFQCEGAFGVDQWVNYFLHSGHLHIEGRKMSKSLKNFITIKEFLKTHTADQWRLLCLLHQYNTTMTYHKESMDLVLGTERKIKEFFQNTSVLLRKFSTNTTRRWYDDEVDLQNRIIESRDAIHKALCDDFDTPKTIHTMMSLITDVNKYVACTKGKREKF